MIPVSSQWVSQPPENNYKEPRPEDITSGVKVSPEAADMTNLYESVKFRRNNQLI